MPSIVSSLLFRGVPPLSKHAACSLLPAFGAAMRRGSSPCIFYHRGFCRFGDSCRYSHADVSVLAGRDVLPFNDRTFAHVQASAVPAKPVSRMRVMSYNILADHLAHEHAQELYKSSPRYALEWGYRSKLILREVVQYLPDVVCLQEVDHFKELQQRLEEQGYDGLYTKRTGDRQDGLATFWRRDVFRPVTQERILYNKLGLKDNVAQIVLLQRRQPGSATSSSSSGGLSGQKRGRIAGGEAPAAEGGSAVEQHQHQPMMTVANIHVLFNPRRGDIKLAQVRTLFEHVQRVSQEHGGAPAVICGDFNSAAGSPIYHYISRGQLDLSQHERKRLSGQVEAQGKGWPSLRHAFLTELYNAQQEEEEQEAKEAAVGGNGRGVLAQAPAPFPLCDEGTALGSVLARMPYDPLRDPYCSMSDPLVMADSGLIVAAAGGGVTASPVTPHALQPFGGMGAPSPGPWQHSSTPFRSGSTSSMSTSSTGRASRGWTAEEICMAMGGPTSTPHFQHQQQSHNSASKARKSAPATLDLAAGDAVAQCPLRVASAYAATTSQEPLFTTCHDKFIGTVDYIWYTPPPPEGGSNSSNSAGPVKPRYALRPVSVLQPPSLQSLRTGMPCGAWPSDHVSLVCDMEIAEVT